MSGAIEVVQAIVARWDERDLDDEFAGGLWYDQVPPREEFPYVVFSMVDDSPTSESDQHTFYSQLIQFEVYVKEDMATDPLINLKLKCSALKAALKYAPLVIPTSVGRVGAVKEAGGDSYTKDPDTEKVWRGLLNFQIKRQEPTDRNPG